MRRRIARLLKVATDFWGVLGVWVLVHWAMGAPPIVPSWQMAVGYLVLSLVAFIAWAFVDPDPPRSSKSAETSE